MDAISIPTPAAASPPRSTRPPAAEKWQAMATQHHDAPPKDGSEPELREAFRDFTGQTLFGSMLASMRKTVGKAPYFHGGRTEEVFQQQLDRHIVQDLTEASADTLADPMYELFTMQRRS